MQRRFAEVFGLVLLLTIVDAARPSAQTVLATLTGMVVDVTGAPIANVDVRVIGDALGVTRTVRSDDGGWFVVSSLAPGAYVLDVSHKGFRRRVQPFTLAVNQRLRLDARLETGALSETVNVEAPRTALELAPGTLTFRMPPDRIANLPLDGRNFLELALLAPGAAPSAPGSAGSVRGDFALHMSGGREDANAFLLDGAYNLDPKLNGVAVRPPVDAIREFEILRSVPDASFGRAGAAHINIVTRSGTNQTSFTAWEFARTGAFNARNFFAPEGEEAPAYRRHQYGAAIGGPLARNRVFFFGDYEGSRHREGITRVTNVPTLAERDGDFSQSLFAPPTIPGFGVPFTDNRIPIGLQHPVGRAIAALFPEPNRDAPFANFVSSPELVDNSHQLDGRIDLVGAGASLYARYSFADRDLFEPFAGPAFSPLPGFGNDVPRRAHNVVVSGVQTLGSRWLHEPRFGWTSVSNAVRQEGQGTSLNQEVGLPELSANSRDWGLSFINVTGFGPLGHEYNNPQEGQAALLHVSDTATWMRGRHLMKFGAEGRWLQQDAFRDVQARGLLQFTPQAFTGNALADLLMGLPTVAVAATVDNPQQLRASSLSVFFQDVMQVSESLTLSAGVRYEVNNPPVDADDRVSVYDPATGSIVPVGQNGIPRGGYETDRNNVAPRVGLAWSASPSTVLRFGYGISYDQTALAPNEFLYFNPPYFDVATFFTLPGLYTLTLTDPFPVTTFPLPLPRSATAVQRDLKTGHLHQWNAAFQQRLGDRRSIEIAYVGSLGRNLIAARDINQPAPSAASPNLRPNPLFADILAIESRGRSRFHALELQFDQRLSGGVSLSAHYTVGQSKDDVSGFFASGGDANFPMDSNNPQAEFARSNFDVRHRFTMSGGIELPFGAGRRWLTAGGASGIIGLWDVFFTVVAQSGRPFSVALGELDQSNTGRANLGFGANDRPDLIGDPEANGGTPEQWFDPAAFALPAFGTFGNVGRNSLEGPGFKNVNVAFAKRIPLQRRALQVRLEIFNFFNTTNFDLPDNLMTSPTFGQILSAGAPRRIQLGFRYVY